MIDTAAPPRDVFFRDAIAPFPLEFQARLRAQGGCTFSTRGVTLADFLSVYRSEMKGEVLVFRMPDALLNPNYWEPYSKERENAVRESKGGIIARTEGVETYLWRADEVAPDRLFRDGVEIPAQLLLGHVFRMRSEHLAAVGRGRVEFVLFRSLPAEVPRDLILETRRDLTQTLLGAPEAELLFASEENGDVRFAFPSPERLRRAADAALRGYARILTGIHAAPLAAKAADDLLGFADGVRLTSVPSYDFVNKHRTFEFTFHATTPDGSEERGRILAYYDVVSGYWGVCR